MLYYKVCSKNFRRHLIRFLSCTCFSMPSALIVSFFTLKSVNKRFLCKKS